MDGESGESTEEDDVTGAERDESEIASLMKRHRELIPEER